MGKGVQVCSGTEGWVGGWVGLEWAEAEGSVA